MTNRIALAFAGFWWGGRGSCNGGPNFNQEAIPKHHCTEEEFPNTTLDQFRLFQPPLTDTPEARPRQTFGDAQNWQRWVLRFILAWKLVYGLEYEDMMTTALEFLLALHREDEDLYRLLLIRNWWSELVWQFTQELEEEYRRILAHARRSRWRCLLQRRRFARRCAASPRTTRAAGLS